MKLYITFKTNLHLVFDLQFIRSYADCLISAGPSKLDFSLQGLQCFLIVIVKRTGY